jgi:hypothetical protein
LKKKVEKETGVVFSPKINRNSKTMNSNRIPIHKRQTTSEKRKEVIGISKMFSQDSGSLVDIKGV